MIRITSCAIGLGAFGALKQAGVDVLKMRYDSDAQIWELVVEWDLLDDIPEYNVTFIEEDGFVRITGISLME